MKINDQLTVDGSEIRRTPVVVGRLSHYLWGFANARWLFGISEPSTVVHGLFQPYISRLDMSRK